MSELSAADTLRKVETAWADRRPLTFTVPFGGYKSWRIESSPLPNLAEVFFVDYLRRYLREVSAVYPYGVRAEFTYISGVMDLVSNHEPPWQQQYVDALERLLRFSADEPPQFALVDIAALHTEVDVRYEVRNNFDRLAPEWAGELTEAQSDKLESARRNFFADGPRAVDNSLEERIHESAILCDALDALPIRRNYNKFGDRIQLVFGRRPEPAVHIGTCEMSTTHFWVSQGRLQWNGKRYYPTMVGHMSQSAATASIPVDEIERLRNDIGTWFPATCGVV